MLEHVDDESLEASVQQKTVGLLQRKKEDGPVALLVGAAVVTDTWRPQSQEEASHCIFR